MAAAYEDLDDVEVAAAYRRFRELSNDSQSPAVVFEFENWPDTLDEDVEKVLLQVTGPTEAVIALEDQHECSRVRYHEAALGGNAPPSLVDGEGRIIMDEQGTWGISTKGWIGAGGGTGRLRFAYYGCALDDAFRAFPPQDFATWDCVSQQNVECIDPNVWEARPVLTKSAAKC